MYKPKFQKLETMYKFNVIVIRFLNRLSSESKTVDS